MTDHEQEQSASTVPPAAALSVASIRLRQVLVIVVGVVAAAVMVFLGLWQMQVYQNQSQQSSLDRAAAPTVDLHDVAESGQVITEGFGRTVRTTGTYNPEFQLLVPVEGEPGRFRVLSGLELADGSVLPVVRGVTTGSQAPTVPTGAIEQSGVLLPSEPAGTGTLPEGQLPSVRLARLAQMWPEPLMSGYVTLGAAQAEAQGLSPDIPDLPEGHGRLRNGAYAFQWWIFAAFAVGMSIRMARDFGARKDYDDLLLSEHDGQARNADRPSGGPAEETTDH